MYLKNLQSAKFKHLVVKRLEDFNQHWETVRIPFRDENPEEITPIRINGEEIK